MTEGLELRELDAISFDEFMSKLKKRYVADQMEGNHLSETEAIEFTESQWASILPAGRLSNGHHFFDLIEPSSGERVGSTWVFVDQTNRSSFIYELFLESSSRGKGLGRMALHTIEDFAKSEGSSSLGLNVFASNDRAESLYRSFGFLEVSTDMIKDL